MLYRSSVAPQQAEYQGPGRLIWIRILFPELAFDTEWIAQQPQTDGSYYAQDC